MNNLWRCAVHLLLVVTIGGSDGHLELCLPLANIAGGGRPERRAPENALDERSRGGVGADIVGWANGAVALNVDVEAFAVVVGGAPGCADGNIVGVLEVVAAVVILLGAALEALENLNVSGRGSCGGGERCVGSVLREGINGVG